MMQGKKKRTVDPNLTKLVLYHRELHAVVLGENPVQECCLSGSKESRDQRDWNLREGRTVGECVKG